MVKSMKNPPEGVKLAMAAVCVMMNVPADRVNDSTTGRKILDYWGPSKRILSDMKFLDYLRDYDKDNIPVNIMQVEWHCALQLTARITCSSFPIPISFALYYYNTISSK